MSRCVLINETGSALALNLLFFRRRRYYFDHFILVTELNTFFVLIGYLIVPSIVYGIMQVRPASEVYFHDGSMFFRILLFSYIIVFAAAIRRFYKEAWGWSALKPILFVVIFFFAIKFIYNIILFYLVMLFIN
jgi:hypothetical protein